MTIVASSNIPPGFVVAVMLVAALMALLIYWGVMHPSQPPKNYWFYGKGDDDSNDNKELPEVFNKKGDNG